MRPGMTIVDLGAAPGGWSQFAARLLDGRGRIVAHGHTADAGTAGRRVHRGDFESTKRCSRQLLSRARRAESRPCDVRHGPQHDGHRGRGPRAVDEPGGTRGGLCRADTAPGGDFCSRCSRAGSSSHCSRELRQHYESVKLRKPKASRAAVPRCTFWHAGCDWCSVKSAVQSAWTSDTQSVQPRSRIERSREERRPLDRDRRRAGDGGQQLQRPRSAVQEMPYSSFLVARQGWQRRSRSRSPGTRSPACVRAASSSWSTTPRRTTRH